jgi:hypothetical protein
MKIKVSDYYGHAPYYRFMPREMFERLECAYLNGHQFAEVSKMMYNEMQQRWLSHIAR